MPWNTTSASATVAQRLPLRVAARQVAAQHALLALVVEEERDRVGEDAVRARARSAARAGWRG